MFCFMSTKSHEQNKTNNEWISEQRIYHTILFVWFKTTVDRSEQAIETDVSCYSRELISNLISVKTKTHGIPYILNDGGKY